MFAKRLIAAVRLAATGFVLLLALLGGLGPAPRAYASHSACRTDPIVVLSDGRRLNLTAVVNVDSSQVRQINYTLHIPVGLSVTRIVYTQGIPGLRESFAYQADLPARRYASTTIIQTPGSTYTAAATLKVALQNGTVVGAASTTGTSNANINLLVSTTQ